jgi:hypothetical protein
MARFVDSTWKIWRQRQEQYLQQRQQQQQQPQPSASAVIVSVCRVAASHVSGFRNNPSSNHWEAYSIDTNELPIGIPYAINGPLRIPHHQWVTVVQLIPLLNHPNNTNNNGGVHLRAVFVDASQLLHAFKPNYQGSEPTTASDGWLPNITPGSAEDWTRAYTTTA